MATSIAPSSFAIPPSYSRTSKSADTVTDTAQNSTANYKRQATTIEANTSKQPTILLPSVATVKVLPKGHSNMNASNAHVLNNIVHMQNDRSQIQANHMLLPANQKLTTICLQDQDQILVSQMMDAQQNKKSITNTSLHDSRLLPNSAERSGTSTPNQR